MKAPKTPRAGSQASSHTAADRPRARAIVPPPYGVDAVDRWTAAAPAAPGADPLPGPLAVSIERLAGVPMGDVRVHRASPVPARIRAAALAVGSDIHLGPDGDRHLPHEAWHVAQQRQGRVHATHRLGGAAINHQPSLEREATRLGDRAASVASAVPPSALATTPQSHVPSAPVAQCRFVDGNTFRQVLDEQREAQEAFAAGEPDDDPVHFTTVGFEHEFAQMTAGPLLGLTHVEVAQTKQVMPYTGLGFSLETDAANALELVSPPLLIETVAAGSPIPRPDHVAHVDTLIKEDLSQEVALQPVLGQLIEGLNDKWAVHFHAIEPVVRAANVTPHAKKPPLFGGRSKTFGLGKENSSGSGKTHWFASKKTSSPSGTGAAADDKGKGEAFEDETSENAPGGKEKEGASPVVKRRPRKDRGSQPFRNVLATPLKPSEKAGSVGISSQVNFAADARSYDVIQGLSELEVRHTDVRAPFVSLRQRIHNVLVEYVDEDSLDANMRAFLRETARVLAGQLAVPSIAWMQRANAEIEGRPWGSWKYRDPARRKGELYDKHRQIRSLVKDVGGAWLKDTLANFGLGLLNDEQWRAVAKLLPQVRGGIAEAFRQVRDTEWPFNPGESTAHAHIALDEFELVLRGWLGEEDGLEHARQRGYGPDKRLELGTHDPRLFGARQDTFIPAARVTKPQHLQDLRLHVIELRRDPKTTLEELYAANLMTMHSQSDEEIAAAIKTEVWRVKQVRERLEKLAGR